MTGSDMLAGVLALNKSAALEKIPQLFARGARLGFPAIPKVPKPVPLPRPAPVAPPSAAPTTPATAPAPSWWRRSLNTAGWAGYPVAAGAAIKSKDMMETAADASVAETMARYQALPWYQRLGMAFAPDDMIADTLRKSRPGSEPFYRNFREFGIPETDIQRLHRIISQ